MTTAFVLKALLLIVVCCAIGLVLFGLMVWPNERRESEEFDDTDDAGA